MSDADNQTADQGSATDEGQQQQSSADQQQQDDKLREEGVKALEAWKKRAKEAEAKAKTADDLAARLAEIEEAQKSETEKALDKARKDALAQASADRDAYWSERIVKAHVTAAASEKLNDPADAQRYLDVSQFKLNENGELDTKEVAAALDALIKERPYLAKQAQQVSKTGSADQGARGAGTRLTDMNSIIRRAAGQR